MRNMAKRETIRGGGINNGIKYLKHLKLRALKGLWEGPYKSQSF
jgi:hypothetical protein